MTLPAEFINSPLAEAVCNISARIVTMSKRIVQEHGCLPLCVIVSRTDAEAGVAIPMSAAVADEITNSPFANVGLRLLEEGLSAGDPDTSVAALVGEGVQMEVPAGSRAMTGQEFRFLAGDDYAAAAAAAGKVKVTRQILIVICCASAVCRLGVPFEGEGAAIVWKDPDAEWFTWEGFREQCGDMSFGMAPKRGSTEMVQ